MNDDGINIILLLYPCKIIINRQSITQYDLYINLVNNLLIYKPILIFTDKQNELFKKNIINIKH